MHSQQKLFSNLESEPSSTQDRPLTQREWSRLVKERDGWRCANWQKLPELDHSLYELNAHHIQPKKLGGKNEIGNGITYCRACHAAEHPENYHHFQLTIIGWGLKIKDMLGNLAGLKPELRYYQLLNFLTDSFHFRSVQKRVIKSVVDDKKHVFVVMPTGGGKSLLYQIPGLLTENPTLVLSPMKALQTDQVKKLLQRWIPATFINSSLYESDIMERIQATLSHQIKFIFIHPKQLLTFSQKSNSVAIKWSKQLTKLEIGLLVVDEGQVVQRYGQSFVREYYFVNKIRELYHQPQTIVLSASASRSARKIIIERLGLGDSQVEEFVTGFFRPNIKLFVHTFDIDIGHTVVEQQPNRWSKLQEIIRQANTSKVLIFTTTTDQVDNLFVLLKNGGLDVLRYHSKLSEKEKELSSRCFSSQINDKCQILVSTSAFGLGVDIPNIRYVIHYTLPFDLNDYYQQLGRAGRDGKPAEAHLFYDIQEGTYMTDWINNKTLENETDEQIKKLRLEALGSEKKALLGYLHTTNRWQYILDYFGEQSQKSEWSWWWLVAGVMVGTLILLGLHQF